jgi:hypothetical protein
VESRGVDQGGNIGGEEGYGVLAGNLQVSLICRTET